MVFYCECSWPMESQAELKAHQASCGVAQTYAERDSLKLQIHEMEEKIAALNTALFIDSEQIKLTVRVNDALYALNSLPFNKGKWTAEEIEKINADAQKLKTLFTEKRKCECGAELAGSDDLMNHRRFCERPVK